MIAFLKTDLDWGVHAGVGQVVRIVIFLLPHRASGDRHHGLQRAIGRFSQALGAGSCIRL